MSRLYSRRESVEEKRNIKKAVFFSLFTVALIVVIFVFGISSAAKFATFLGNFKKSGQSVDTSDITPPAPPRINSLPEAVNKPSLDIGGSAEPGATVDISVNDSKSEVVVNNEGAFTYTVNLTKGENLISAIAKDSAGNESQRSSVYKVVYDTEKPKLDISFPTDGAKFSGDKQKQLNIKGQTKFNSTLTINDRFVKVDDSGNFSYTLSLSEGDNSLNFIVTDQAGNTIEKTLKVNFTP